MEFKSNLIEAHIVRKNEDRIEYLILKRSSNEKYPDIWQMVTGKVRENEKAYEAVIREISEETNLQVSKLWVVPHVNSFYNSKDNSVNLIPVFVALVSSDQNVELSKEHQKYLWSKKSEAKKLFAWPGQVKSLNIIHDYFKQKNTSHNFIEIKL